MIHTNFARLLSFQGVELQPQNYSQIRREAETESHGSQEDSRVAKGFFLCPRLSLLLFCLRRAFQESKVFSAALALAGM